MEKVKNVLATIIAWVKSHVKLVAIIAAVIIVAIMEDQKEQLNLI